MGYKEIVINLNGKWKLCYSNKMCDFQMIEDIKREQIDVINATVPGNFEIDLMNNKILADIYFGDNIKECVAYESYHKWYFTTFSFDGNSENLYIRFEGLDCLSEIYLNGVLILETDNMMISHECNVENIIKDKNEIIVHFKPVITEALKFDYPLYTGAFPINYESLYVRKAPHMYGWDIFPRIVSAGIFKDVYLYQKKHLIEEIHIDTMSINDSSAKMLLYFKLNIPSFNMSDYELAIEAFSGDQKVSEKINVMFIAGKYNFTINDPKLWWPNRKGIANLYMGKVTLLYKGKAIDEIEVTFGIRIVTLLRSDVTNNSGDGEFLFTINNERVFILGTNWVPADALHSRDKEKLPEMISMVKDLGCNMIRCWGGNIYEDDLFYELCDQQGLMVWQDFSFGCAIYPQDQQFIEKVEEEATAVIKRLRTHACLVMWAGDNEVDCAHSWFGRSTNPNSNIINRDVLKKMVNLHDTYKEYLPSSPFISEKGYKQGDEFLPEYHLWGPRDYYKGDFYINANCHFASEMGYHGCPEEESVQKFISKECLWPYDNIEWLYHCTSPIPDRFTNYNFRVQLMADQIKVLFGEIPDNLHDFSIASQISQGEAMKFFVEMFRSQKWRKTGIIWWNLIDGWPQFSDAVVDYYFKKKIAYEYIKRSQQLILVMLDEVKNNKHEVLICNDTRINEKVGIEIYDEHDTLIFKKQCFSLKDEVLSVGHITVNEDEKHLYKIYYTVNSKQFKNHYLAGKPSFSYSWYTDKINSL